MEEKILVYAAGDTRAYPLEYYDGQTASYQGVVPRLLEDFSAQSGYRVAYYPNPGGESRESLAENLQVDMLYGCAPAQELPPQDQCVTLFEAQDQGQTMVHYILFTPAAPQGLKEELEGFVAGLSQPQLNAMLLQAAAGALPGEKAPLAAVGGLALGAAVLAAALALTVRRYRRRLARVRRELEEDQATGLGNVDYLRRCWKRSVTRNNRALLDLICFHVNLHRMRLISGSAEAEQALRHCAQTLRACAGEGGAPARISQEDLVLLRQDTNRKETLAWIQDTLERMRACPQGEGKTLEVEVCAGICPLGEEEGDLDKMIFNAVQAAAAAREEEKDWAVVSQAMRKALQVRQELCAGVGAALEKEEFQLYIQFYVDAQTNRIVGGEALSRWLHPKYGLQMPGAFVPMLEAEGLTYKLDYHCLRVSCDFLQALTDQGVDDFFLSCNFSRQTFADAAFPSRCMDILGRYSFPRKRLVFELTESVAAKHPARIRENILALKEQGIRIVLDDFGQGFTAFSDLQQYPVDGIKLDKGLVDHVLTHTGLTILRGMIQVGHTLGLSILAEGVESDAQARTLGQINCDVIQGYHFYVPIPQEEAMERVLKQLRTAPAPEMPPAPFHPGP